MTVVAEVVREALGRATGDSDMVLTARLVEDALRDAGLLASGGSGEAPARLDEAEERVRANSNASYFWKARAQMAEAALKAISGPSDSGPFIEVYRAAGGGYEGLQAIADEALERVGP